MNIRVLIVEDENEWIELYSQELSPYDNIEIVGIAKSINKAVEAAKLIKPDIILMDLNLSKNNFEGIMAIAEILQYLNTKIIVVTSHFEKALIDEAFYVGAVEYILKHQLQRLPVVINDVYTNDSPHVILANSFARHRKESQYKSLTKTEKEILQLKKKGLTHNAIVKMTYKTKSTLKHQITSLLKKLNVTSCQEAIKKFRQFIE